jgi:hypothetical protein
MVTKTVDRLKTRVSEASWHGSMPHGSMPDGSMPHGDNRKRGRVFIMLLLPVLIVFWLVGWVLSSSDSSK